jgi:UDP-N-acetylglucosamine--N-acetylmuramyl-(pentapeptide) pyrophosphoryl-undecaprenol N-acetylglucosamine transferase
VIHLSGQADREAVAGAYRETGIRAEVVAFLDNMWLAYRAADFALSRAGGTTIAELTACGVPPILVPYPNAANDHQRHNARAIADAGAAVVLEQDDFTPGRLVAMICKFITDQNLAKRMQRTCLALGRPQAADVIYDALQTYAQTRTDNGAVEALRPEPATKEHT